MYGKMRNVKSHNLSIFPEYSDHHARLVKEWGGNDVHIHANLFKHRVTYLPYFIHLGKKSNVDSH